MRIGNPRRDLDVKLTTKFFTFRALARSLMVGGVKVTATSFMFRGVTCPQVS